jgi:Short C-terminal domain
MPLRRRPVARIATTAVVAGTAANMGARSAQRSAAAAQAQAQPQAQPQDAPPAPADEAAAPEPAASPEVEQLKQFAALRDQGILTEEEFAAKKAQILGI